MDIYFVAASDAAALEVKDLTAGPTPNSNFDAVEAKDVMACPHLEQLIEIATGKSGPSLVPLLVTLWPDPRSFGDEAGYVPGPMICRLPDALRDDLARLAIDGDVAERWAAELWGYDPSDAWPIAEQMVALASRALAAGHALYWYSET